MQVSGHSQVCHRNACCSIIVNSQNSGWWVKAVRVWQCDDEYILSAPGLSFLAPRAPTCSLPQESHDPHQPEHIWKTLRRSTVKAPGKTLLCDGFWTVEPPPPPLLRTWARASTWCSRIGLLQNSTSGLGTLRVSGRSRVPNPPTRIRAFMLIAVRKRYQGDQRTSMTQQPAWPEKSGVTGKGDVS